MSDRAIRPFWLHQLVEYIVGIAVLAQGMQDPEPVIPSLAGILIIVNAAAVRGPMGAFKFIGRSVHRWLDIGVAAVLVAAALQPWVEIEFTGRIMLIGVLIPLGFSWFYTDWHERPARRNRRVGGASERSGDIGRSAGRMAGSAYVAGRKAIKKRSEPDS